jgi:hypothetical protein
VCEAIVAGGDAAKVLSLYNRFVRWAAKGCGWTFALEYVAIIEREIGRAL